LARAARVDGSDFEGVCSSKRSRERMPGTPIRGESGCQAPPVNAPRHADSRRIGMPGTSTEHPTLGLRGVVEKSKIQNPKFEISCARVFLIVQPPHAFAGDVCVDLGGCQRRMAEHHLNRSQVGAVLYQVGGE